RGDEDVALADVAVGHALPALHATCLMEEPVFRGIRARRCTTMARRLLQIGTMRPKDETTPPITEPNDAKATEPLPEADEATALERAEEEARSKTSNVERAEEIAEDYSDVSDV